MAETEKQLLVYTARLRDGGEEFEGVLDDSVLDMHDKWTHPFGGVRYNLFVQPVGQEILVRGTLSQDFVSVCSRCGCDFDFTAVVDDFAASFEIDERSEYVDLTDEIRQSIILALPNYPVCREDCKGVCPSCGKNLNLGGCDCAAARDGVRWSGLDGLAN